MRWSRRQRRVTQRVQERVRQLDRGRQRRRRTTAMCTRSSTKRLGARVIHFRSGLHGIHTHATAVGGSRFVLALCSVRLSAQTVSQAQPQSMANTAQLCSHKRENRRVRIRCGLTHSGCFALGALPLRSSAVRHALTKSKSSACKPSGHCTALVVRSISCVLLRHVPTGMVCCRQAVPVTNNWTRTAGLGAL